MSNEEVLAWARELPIKQLRNLRKGLRDISRERIKELRLSQYLDTLDADGVRELEKQVHQRKKDLQDGAT